MESDAGESGYFISEDGSYIAHEDIAQFEREQINPKEKIKNFGIINQPEWVKTMDDNVKHYKLPTSRFLKNVVYKNTTNGEIIIAVIRGDLDVNKSKLESNLKVIGQLIEADETDLEKIGTQHGYVHSWGHKHRDGNKVRYIGDLSLTTVTNFIGGYKSDTQDSVNVNYGRDFECELLADIAGAVPGHKTVGAQSKLILKKGIEVGNLFNLEYHYSKKMADATFTDKNNSEVSYYMGSYGIGIERTMAAVVESLHDDKGIIWPENIAPYKAHLIGLGMEDRSLHTKAFEVYEKLQKAGVEILFDDRFEVSAGEKMADADLIGCPYRLIVSPKTKDKIEIKKRSENRSLLYSIEEIKNLLGV
ncbi:hypothetical protein A2V49_04465 [candidate division WWE3 bacterium RBG_19FT_COMBO_34_6]|uniref:Proline--tRNA ligase n=1 Tax=candidate division WWE3 bacterium RBG_19FT_COMBO_34_6 TaxID=1802612 RepID=A0A1F4UPT7_UNCKA|nr:MAG: hypothetical protein A2V49_04465 [candidate division WWE3 bacterium RBG_19FT_COMBO_34_6]